MQTIDCMLKKTIIISLLLLAFLPILQAQGYREINHNAFQRGEHLEFKVYWDAWILPHIRAGNAIMEITEEKRMFGDRNIYHIVGSGCTKGMVNMFYKVNDRYETYIDEEALIPWLFIRRTQEGSYVRNDDVTFEHDERQARSSEAIKEIPENVQDILSAVYFVRTFDFSNIQLNDTIPVAFFLDDSVYTSIVIYEGKDIVKTKLGKFNCLKFKPGVLVGPVFLEPFPMTLWVTDDDNHIPILAESKVLVGSVKFELINYYGLANPLSARFE